MVRLQTRKKRNAITQGLGPYQCHPSMKHDRPAEGCLPKAVLRKIAESVGINPSAPKLRAILEQKLQVEPKKEWSFLKASPLPDEDKAALAKQYLRPKQPDAWVSDPDMWLDSNNIEEVMKQYEDAYPDFEFMGPYPIDFGAPDPYAKGQKKCLINEMCELRVTDAIKNGTKHIGVIYNLDPHFKGGSHWVGLFINLEKHMTNYFDSYGMYPPKQVAKFMKWLTVQDPKMKLGYNGRRFQQKNSECGMYSLYFIIRMIHGDNFRAFSRQAPPDEEMLKLRHWIFST